MIVRFLRILRIAGWLAVYWLVGLLWFASTIPLESPAPGSPAFERVTDAIVVLTGGSERLAVGMDLLAAGKAQKLLVSGVNHSVDKHDLLRVTHLRPAEAECCIVLGYAADSTIGNAAETAAWMRTEHFSSLRLVTANYHLRRSLLEFRLALPDAEIVPHPVIPASVKVADWWMWRRTTSLIVTEYNKYIIALIRALILQIINA